MDSTTLREDRCLHYMQTARAFAAAGRKIPGHILGMLARSSPIWKNWPDVPKQVRDATRLYWDVKNRTNDAKNVGNLGRGAS